MQDSWHGPDRMEATRSWRDETEVVSISSSFLSVAMEGTEDGTEDAQASKRTHDSILRCMTECY